MFAEQDTKHQVVDAGYALSHVTFGHAGTIFQQIHTPLR
jgi:hypothetical protein